MKGLTTWYEIAAIEIRKTPAIGGDRNTKAELETLSAGNLHGAKTRVAELRAKYPAAHMIFVKRHQKGGRVVCLHELTVHEGTTAAERRAAANVCPSCGRPMAGGRHCAECKEAARTLEAMERGNHA